MPTLVCYGDSLTAKEKDANGDRRLTSRIRDNMPNWVVINAGIPNGTSRDGIERFQEDVLFHKPDIVTILFGTKDAMSPQQITINEFRTNLTYMIRKLTPERTILISPLPLEHIPKEILAHYAEETRRLADETGCYFIDLWRMTHEQRLLRSSVRTIGRRGYDLLANKIMGQLTTIAKRKKLRSP